MKTLYLDCFAGIAGDMFLGAMLDLGLDREAFLKTMEGIVLFPDGHHGHHHDEDHHHHHHDHEHGSDRLSIAIRPWTRNGVTGTKVDVEALEGHPHRGLADVTAIIEASPLSPWVKERSTAAFRLLAEAEGKVHGVAAEEVHFHEVGAIDSIADVIGAFVLAEMSGAGRVVCSSVNVGSGTVQCAHGLLPVPAPATAELLMGLPVHSLGSPMERTTPTGALIARCLASEFGTLPAGKILASGRGFGTRDSDIPNALRVFLMETEDPATQDTFQRDRGVVMETNIDDMNPQYYPPVMERLFAAGALDVWLTPIHMKKGRPATMLCCLCTPEKEEPLAEILLRETTTLGLRKYTVDRMKTKHEIEVRPTEWGDVRFKTARLGGNFLRVNPEYEDVRRISEETGRPLSEVREALLRSFGG